MVKVTAAAAALDTGTGNDQNMEEPWKLVYLDKKNKQTNKRTIKICNNHHFTGTDSLYKLSTVGKVIHV